MDSETNHVKEVFAIYGAAMYEAQCVEKQLAILGATKYNSNASKMRLEEYDELFKRLLEKTLGAIYKHIQKEAQIEIESKNFIEEGIFVRNWLAHDYFWQRAGYLPTYEGRQKMITELHLIHDKLAELDRTLTRISRDWGKERGVTDEMISQLTEDLIANPDQKE